MRLRTSVVLLLLTAAAPAWAQPRQSITHLGGPAAFYKPALTDLRSLKRFAETQEASIYLALAQSDVADEFLAAISQTDAVQNLGVCGTMLPGDGIIECQMPVGSTFEWMAYRPLRNGKRSPERLQSVLWAGKEPFAAFMVQVTVDNKIYTFAIPKPCGNISLVGIREAARATAPPPQAPAAPVAAPQQQRAVEVIINNGIGGPTVDQHPAEGPGPLVRVTINNNVATPAPAVAPAPQAPPLAPTAPPTASGKKQDCHCFIRTPRWKSQ